MLTSKQWCFAEPEHWAQMKPDGRVQGGEAKLDMSVIRSELKGEKKEQGEMGGGQEAACVVQSPEMYG